MAELAAPAPPKLSAHDLQAELARFHAEPHRTWHTACYGTGEAQHLQLTVRGEPKLFRVVPVDCELRLREELSQCSDTEPLVLLVDYTQRLPLDVEGRLAHGGLLFISRERRLATLFGAKSVSPRLLDGPLAEALLSEGRPFEVRLEGSTLDEHVAWRAYLSRCAGLSSLGELTEASVIEQLAAQNGALRGPGVIAATPGLDDAARAYLDRTAGPIAALAWDAWQRGLALHIAGLTFIIEPLADERNDYVLGFLEGQFSELGHALASDRTLLLRWQQIAPALALRLDQHPALRERVLQTADERVHDKPKLQPFLARSRFLSSGMRAQQLELAQLLEEIASKAALTARSAVPHEAVTAAIEAYRRMCNHRLAGTPEMQHVCEQAGMGLRLACYLHGQAARDEALDALHAPHEIARALAEHHAAEGGFVDYARRMARAGVAQDALGAAVAKLLSVVDAVRDAQDSRFGPALKRWNEERKPGALLPIEHALDTLGLSLLREHTDAKLLILVMDGLAWDAAIELLLDLRTLNYGPLRFTPKALAAHRTTVPMIAALPTMTEVSRAALFAGRLLRVGEKTSTLKDPARLLEHRAFVKAFGQGPRLLLRTEAEDNAGHVTAAARELVESKDRAVALVLNAVDDMLSATPSYRPSYTRQTIKALGPLLEAASTAERVVLLVADHGHVLSDRPRQVVKVDGADSPRYRELSSKALTSDRELVLDDANTHRQRAGDRVGLLYRETERYRDAHNLGEHGGASLAEVVAPALLIAADDLHQRVGSDATDNDALQTVAWPIPAWWNLELPAPAKARQPSERPARGAEMPKPSKKSQVPEGQLRFFDLPGPANSTSAPTAASSAAPRAPVASEWSRRIEAQYAHEPKARRDELKQVLPVLDLLLEHAGRLSDEVLAGKLGVAQRNVGGLVAILGEFVNLDGYAVVSYTVSSKQVGLDQDLMRELFGEEA